MKKFLRIENLQSGKGPFISDVKMPNMEKLHDRNMYNLYNDFFVHKKDDEVLNEGLITRMVGPELNGNSTKDLFCAYADFETFLGFIDVPELLTLIDEGFRIFEISLDNFYEASQQIAFFKSDIIEKVDVTNEMIEEIIRTKITYDINNSWKRLTEETSLVTAYLVRYLEHSNNRLYKDIKSAIELHDAFLFKVASKIAKVTVNVDWEKIKDGLDTAFHINGKEFIDWDEVVEAIFLDEMHKLGKSEYTH